MKVGDAPHWRLYVGHHLAKSSSCLLVVECSYEGRRGPTRVSMWGII